MEIRQLRTFRTVAGLLSFNRAAEQLHYAQSSVSAQIQSLEEELDVRLFDRLGRRILLTEAGDRLVQYAEKVLALVDETHAEITGAKEPRGALTIRVPESLGVYRFPLVIKEFRTRFPKVALHFTTCAHEGLRKDLRRGIIDLAFLLTESVQETDMQGEVLGFESIVMVASPSHPLAANSSVRNMDLEGETVLLSKVDCSYRRSFEKILEEKGIRLGSALVFHSVAALKQCVMAGVGITILPELAVTEEVAEGKLTVLNWEEGVIEVASFMIWFKERWISPTLEAFMGVSRKMLKNSSSSGAIG